MVPAHSEPKVWACQTATPSHDSEQEGPYLAPGNLERNLILYLQRTLRFRKLERLSRKKVFLRLQVFLKHQKGHRGSQPFHLWAVEMGNDHMTPREGQLMTRCFRWHSLRVGSTALCLYHQKVFVTVLSSTFLVQEM